VSASARISPTAHYTGYVWARNGLSHEQLSTIEGRVLYESIRGPMGVSAAVGGYSLERYLLARHRSIDELLGHAIDEGTVSQVIEVACGLSPRGWRFTERYGDRLHYVEADLPGMAERKREALARMGSLSPTHEVVTIDALAEAGPDSVAGVAHRLDHRRGTAIITEGLLGYLDKASVTSIWRRFATALHTFPAGRYFSDLHLSEGVTPQVRAFRLALAAFVRGGVHLHFDQPRPATEALLQAGFDTATVRPAWVGEEDGRRGGGRVVHIIEASTVRSQ
jgi:O-methyltransferase involved in polyketide biosynthesis